MFNDELGEILDDFMDRRGLYLLAGLLMLAVLIGYLVADLEHEIDELRREFRARMRSFSYALAPSADPEPDPIPPMVDNDVRPVESSEQRD